MIFDDFSSPLSDFIKPFGIGEMNNARSFRKKQAFSYKALSCEVYVTFPSRKPFEINWLLEGFQSLSHKARY